MAPAGGSAILGTASWASVRGGMLMPGGVLPGVTQAYRGSGRHSAAPAVPAAGLTGSSNQVPSGGGGLSRKPLACWTDWLIWKVVGAWAGSSPHSLTMAWLPVVPSPIGSHRQGGGGMFTARVVAPGGELGPPKGPISSSMISHESPVEQPTLEVPLAARAALAVSAGPRAAVTIRAAAAARARARGPRAAGTALTACPPSPADSRWRAGPRPPASPRWSPWPAGRC